MTQQTYSITRCIHWLSALLIIAMLITGVLMKRAEIYSLYPLHKSFGVIAMALILLRLMHRRREKWQSSARNTPQYNLVNKAHQLLLFASVAMPVTGLLLSGLSGHGVALFGLSLIPSNYLDNTAVPFSELGYVVASWLHTIVGYAFFILVIGHILAALKHHFISKDNTLKRMLSARYN